MVIYDDTPLGGYPIFRQTSVDSSFLLKLGNESTTCHCMLLESHEIPRGKCWNLKSPSFERIPIFHHLRWRDHQSIFREKSSLTHTFHIFSLDSLDQIRFNSPCVSPHKFPPPLLQRENPHPHCDAPGRWVSDKQVGQAIHPFLGLNLKRFHGKWFVTCFMFCTFFMCLFNLYTSNVYIQVNASHWWEGQLVMLLLLLSQCVQLVNEYSWG